MKKYFTLMVLTIFGGLLMMSCEMNEVVDRDIQDNDTYPVMKDVTGTFSSTNNYALDQAIDIPSSDVVLVYRNINSNSSASAIWQLLPKTFYLSDNRELDYNFIFDTKRVQVRTEANFDQSTMTSTEKATYLNNQTFRIVLVPASRANRTASQVNYEDYNAVVKYFNLKEPK